MAGLIKRRGHAIFRSQTLSFIYSKFQRSNYTLAESEGVMEKCSSIRSVIDEDTNSVDTSKWKKVRASDAGIRNSMIPESSMNVLRLLRRQGFDAYLVGGCVRDLVLHRVPKDYDVITTANLKQIRRLFHRAQVIGKRFPICHVWMGGSIIEVSSFDTVAHSDSEHENDSGKSEEKKYDVLQNTEANKNSSVLNMYSGLDVKDCSRWRNSFQRDFTVNSLFYDPFELKIYDYSNGMEDLKDLKLRTLVPARMSFSEDCARILRGLRIAARLGLSLSKDIKTTIPDFVSSIANLGQFRIILEMNYMLAYGAAAPSILLLMKFKLLHVLLPFQAAYLDQASKTSLPSSLMLMKLFSNMDKLVSCDRPADSRLWIVLLAFHIALVSKPQEAIVLRAFASLLYHRNWSRAVKFAREHEHSIPGYAPEVSKSSRKRSDEDLAKAVSAFTYLLNDTLYVLTDMEALREALCLYPHFKCSGLVFIPKKKGREIADWFARLSDVESYGSKKEGFAIDYISLGKGVPCELGFVLGKIILDTIIEQPYTVEMKHSAGNQVVPEACMQKKAELVVSKPSKEGQAPINGSKPSSVFKAHQKILKKMREDSKNKNDQEAEVCPESTFSGQAMNQDQSVVVQKPKRRHKESQVPEEAPKQKTSKRSKSDEQETVETPSAPAKNQHQSVGPKNNKRGTKPPVSDQPKQKTSKNRSKEAETVKHKDIPVKKIQDAKQSIVPDFPDKCMSDLLKVLVKPSQQESTKEESESLSSEKTKKPRKLSSLFR
uniref:Poly(A) polymerase I n=1 Tax=Noccaea caerulescens TaxID=107243 RepID=A0A1J3K9G1_NOCCA